MKIGKRLITSLVVVTMLTAASFAEHVRVDYDHSANFGNYHTYTWQKVETANSIWDARVRCHRQGASSKGLDSSPFRRRHSSGSHSNQSHQATVKHFL